MIIRRFLPFAASFFLSFPALAAGGGGDWTSEVTDKVNSFTDSIVSFGGPILGLALVGVGLWAVMTGRVDWSLFWKLLIGALLVTVGPFAAKFFFGN